MEIHSHQFMMHSVDIYLPTGVQPLVCIGQIMVSGETVIADLNSKELARDGRKE